MNTNGLILVVDDTPADLELLLDTLTAQGYQVLPADNGERALGLESPAQMLPPNTAAMVRECLATGEPKLRMETQTGPCYVQKHSEATFTHGLCPDCIKKWYPELEEASPDDSRTATS